MSWEVNTKDDRSAPVITDLSADQFRIVKDDGSGNLALSTSATDQHLGVLQNNPKGAAGSGARVGSYRPVGVSKVVAGAAVAVGIAVTSDGQGRAVTAVAGNSILGITREPAAAAGVVIAVDLARGPLV